LKAANEKIEHCDALVIGSGAAGLAAAARLRAEGVADVAVLTEGLSGGTSVNTGSDKQTYYKLGLCGDEPDSPMRMAGTYLVGGAAHGDIALVEAALSARCFSHLCDIGVMFPHDAFGQYAGYQTDHDPARRATSVGPYTSRDMCARLLDECRMRGVRFIEGFLAVRLLTEPTGDRARPIRCTGAVALPLDGAVAVPLEIRAADTVFATGGPGGLYSRSVYPAVHMGGIGIALAAGARARNLPLSQFGLASTRFRWNVSGTYMQALPRFISTAPDGVGNPRDFVVEAFGGDAAAAASMAFLKGYQWPFDAEKAGNGSSRIDLLVREETIGRGCRVFLDFRTETPGLDIGALSPEAHGYLARSGALEGPPIKRLLRMNPGAVALYLEHGIDIAKERLEIALCAQHNNGGLAADAWWQSENVAHLWPVGEVNGSHGVRRPGGSALNAGQVGAFRAAEAIAHFARREGVAGNPEGHQDGRDDARECRGLEEVEKGRLAAAQSRGTLDWRAERRAMQARMDAAAGPVRRACDLERAASDARAQLASIRASGFLPPRSARDAAEACRTETLCLASVAYLEACLEEVRAGAGSRGSAIVLDGAAPVDGAPIPENRAFRNLVQETELAPGRTSPDAPMFRHRFSPCRPLPSPDTWFENVWRDYREGRAFENQRHWTEGDSAVTK